ncbi:MAG: amidase, partial [Betaproteobacteria bacterium]
MTDEEISWLDLSTVARLIRERVLSSEQVTQAQLRRIERLDPTIHAYAYVTSELALTQARAADQRQAQGQALGPLHGVPIAVKDLCWTAGIPTAAGMQIYKDFVPNQDATVVQRLHEAGAVLLGKLQMTESAFSGHHPLTVVPVNPWEASAWTGVSSSGSGVATAAGLCFGSLGTDTGGSIRFPSAACGVTGLKPTWGRVSRYGVFELAASLDHIGPMCRTAEDCGLMLGVLAGADPKDPTALQAPVPDYSAGNKDNLSGLRIGWDAAYALNDVESEVAQAVKQTLAVLEKLGAQIVPITMPEVGDLVENWVPHCGIEAAVAHTNTYPSRRAEYGPMLAGLLDIGNKLTATDYQRILLQRATHTGQLNAVLMQVDLILMPAMPFAAPSTERIANMRKESGYRRLMSRFTAPTDMSGHPTLTFPAGETAAGLPVAAQLVSGHLNEGLLVRAGSAFQNATQWHLRR